MRLYIVGSPESIHGPIGDREFGKKEIADNINALSSVRIFDSYTHASNYARSLRIVRTPIARYSDSERTQLAPIVYVDVADTNEKYQFNSTTTQRETVNFKTYKGTYFNFPEKDSAGRDLVTQAEISFISMPRSSFDMKEIKLVAVVFADSGHNAAPLSSFAKCRIL